MIIRNQNHRQFLLGAKTHFGVNIEFTVAKAVEALNNPEASVQRFLEKLIKLGKIRLEQRMVGGHRRNYYSVVGETAEIIPPGQVKPLPVNGLQTIWQSPDTLLPPSWKNPNAEPPKVKKRLQSWDDAIESLLEQTPGKWFTTYCLVDFCRLPRTRTNHVMAGEVLRKMVETGRLERKRDETLKRLVYREVNTDE
jgi:hypothetical protein